MGSPGLPRCHNVMHAMVLDPGARQGQAIAALSVLTSASLKASSYPNYHLSELSPFIPADDRSALNGLRPTCLLSYA